MYLLGCTVDRIYTLLNSVELHKPDIRCFLRLKVYTPSCFGQMFVVNISFPLIRSQEKLIPACSKEMCTYRDQSRNAVVQQG